MLTGLRISARAAAAAPRLPFRAVLLALVALQLAGVLPEWAPLAAWAVQVTVAAGAVVLAGLVWWVWRWVL
jgi:hypothetical protein